MGTAAVYAHGPVVTKPEPKVLQDPSAQLDVVPPAAARSRLTRIVAVVALLFGAATLLAGGRVLLGADPGYRVFQPLLVFNTAMGIAYLGVGLLLGYRSRLAVAGAGLIVLANAAMFMFIAFLYRTDDVVARTSVLAMAFRTGVWIVLLLALLWSQRQARAGRVNT